MTDQDNTPAWVYRSSRKAEMYIYLAAEEHFDAIPEALLHSFGRPLFVMQLELDEQRQLAREDVCKVIRNLHDKGFHLQMPPTLIPTLYHGNED